tara:strand:+ start:54 stop:209 length:156 start_codon:yes stop_codon:yes gene_type:complete
MKELIEALEFCKEHNIYDKYINIALGKNLYAQTWEEGAIQIKIRKYEENLL